MKKQILSSLPLFSSLPASEIEHLAETLRTRTFPEGTILLQEGATDKHFFIMLEGQVEILKALGTPDERMLAVRGRGTMLGEMSLFTPHHTHTASVRAFTEIQALEMTRPEFDALLQRQPRLAYAMVGLMTQRLEASENQTILELRVKNRQLQQTYNELQAAQVALVEKERLEKELEIARQIQLSILPQKLPAAPGYDLGALMVPARAVGGDFYDFFLLGEDQLGIAVGDVSDKGVPSALFMALTFSLVRAEASRSVLPCDSLRSVNRHLLDISATNMFVTLLYGVLHLPSGRFRYARAGQLPPLLLDSAGELTRPPRTTGQALGLFEDTLLDEQEIVLPTGGRLLIFSDGLSEAMDETGNDFGVERLVQALRAAPQASAQEICDLLWQAVQDFSAGLPQMDDFTVVTVQRS